jgi:hypothetical protein
MCSRFTCIFRGLQENILAPRALHFSYDQLFWECREHQACERFPKGDSRLVEAGVDSIAYLKSRFHEYDDATSLDIVHTGTARRYEDCMDLIMAYSLTSLTNPLDRLVALSGIAKFMSRLIRDTCVAGMWRHRSVGQSMSPYSQA